MPSPKILVIVPAFNESGNIALVIEEIRRLHPEVRVVVIDDSSADSTRAEALAAAAEVVPLPINLGIGGAVQTGFLYAVRNNFDIALQLDGDGQHDPAFIPAIIGPIIADEADIVAGSRFIGPYLGYQSSFVRRIGIHFFAHLISFLTRYKITDPTSGFRAFNRKAITIFARSYPTDFPEPESIVMAKRCGLRLIEVPVQMRKRVAGHSSIRYLKTLYYMVKVTFAILLGMIKTKRP